MRLAILVTRGRSLQYTRLWHHPPTFILAVKSCRVEVQKLPNVVIWLPFGLALRWFCVRVLQYIVTNAGATLLFLVLAPHRYQMPYKYALKPIASLG